MMPEKLTNLTSSFSEWVTYLWVIALSSLGGIVHYFHTISITRAKFNLIIFFGEILTSAFVGIITFFLCDAADFSWQTTAAMVGISGHMGTRAIFKLEQIRNKIL